MLFTSTTVAVEADSESKVGGKLDLPGVPCDHQTSYWTERRHNKLTVHLQNIQHGVHSNLHDRRHLKLRRPSLTRTFIFCRKLTLTP